MITETYPIIDLPIEGTLLEDARLIRYAIDHSAGNAIIDLNYLKDEGFKTFLGENTPEEEIWGKLLEYIDTL